MIKPKGDEGNSCEINKFSQYIIIIVLHSKLQLLCSTLVYLCLSVRESSYVKCPRINNNDGIFEGVVFGDISMYYVVKRKPHASKLQYGLREI